MKRETTYKKEPNSASRGEKYNIYKKCHQSKGIDTVEEKISETENTETQTIETTQTEV